MHGPHHRSTHVLYSCRHLQKSPLLQCESPEAAEKAVALLRTQAALNHHRGGPAMAGGPRRVLVIINPHSGQGM